MKNRPINKNGPTLERKYGIEVVSFVLNETRFGDKLVQATEEKKRRQLIAEADNYAADQEAQGTSGSGKIATAKEALEKVVFRNEVIPMVDWRKKRNEILGGYSLFTQLEDVDPEFAMQIAKKKKTDFYLRLAKIPILKRIFRKRIMNNLTDFEDLGILVDMSVITPNDYQTALSGEPGNYFKRRAMGHPRVTSIRHIEEAHSAFGKSGSGTGSDGVEKQQRTLIDTSNIILDEILKRVNAIRSYLQDPDREKFISHEKIFKTYIETKNSRFSSNEKFS
ncbi:MAG: hypothetical protein ACQETR_09935 [Thermodesulfobacteriota bacterium]